MRLLSLSLWLCFCTPEALLLQPLLILRQQAASLTGVFFTSLSQEEHPAVISGGGVQPTSTTPTFRKIEESDIPDLVRLYVREYGPSNTNQRQFTLFPRKLLDNQEKLRDVADFCDNFVLACVLYLSLYQRIKRRWITEPDHQVWCLATGDEIVGALELSLEPCGQTASPVCLPIEVKELFDENSSLQPYISNVIVKKTLRGRGYGSILLQEIEHEAFRLGYNNLTLHVDANSKAARALYDKTGYDLLDAQKGPDIIGRIVRFLAGLYFIEDAQLLYMRKSLKQIRVDAVEMAATKWP